MRLRQKNGAKSVQARILSGIALGLLVAAPTGWCDLWEVVGVYSPHSEPHQGLVLALRRRDRTRFLIGLSRFGPAGLWNGIEDRLLNLPFPTVEFSDSELLYQFSTDKDMQQYWRDYLEQHLDRFEWIGSGFWVQDAEVVRLPKSWDGKGLEVKPADWRLPCHHFVASSASDLN